MRGSIFQKVTAPVSARGEGGEGGGSAILIFNTMTHSHVCHGSHMRDMTHSCVCHGSFMCMASLSCV